MQTPNKYPKKLIVGFRGAVLEDDAPILRMIRNDGLAGVILYDYNIESFEQLQSLCTRLRDASGSSEFLIAIDQEGGQVARLRPDKGFPPFPSQAKLAKQGVDATRRHAAEQAALLKYIGINLNFAPVVDLVTNSMSYIAKRERGYDADPDAVADHAAAMIAEYRKQGVVTCLKHFPGHGSSRGDTHCGFVDITDTWSKRELIPYRRLIQDDLVDMVMLSHVFHRELDSERPASLSRIIVTELLRGDLGYRGPIITDDLQMDAIAHHYTEQEALDLALDAGADYLIMKQMM